VKKVTFIHVSKIIERRSSCMLMPLGLVALANFLKRNHISSEVIYLELEEILNPKFNLIVLEKAFSKVFYEILNSYQLG